jgi:hypothetical protein
VVLSDYDEALASSSCRLRTSEADHLASSRNIITTAVPALTCIHLRVVTIHKYTNTYPS